MFLVIFFKDQIRKPPKSTAGYGPNPLSLDGCSSKRDEDFRL